MAHSFSTQADELATRFPTLLRRLHTKCAKDPGKKKEYKKWWENLLRDDFPLMHKAYEHKRRDIMEEMLLGGERLAAILRDSTQTTSKLRVL